VGGGEGAVLAGGGGDGGTGEAVGGVPMADKGKLQLMLVVDYDLHGSSLLTLKDQLRALLIGVVGDHRAEVAPAVLTMYVTGAETTPMEIAPHYAHVHIATCTCCHTPQQGACAAAGCEQCREACLEDRDDAEQAALQGRVVSLREFDDDGLNVVDPTTGQHYFQCNSCGHVGDLDDAHSGGECNFCHAVNKED